MQNVIRRKIPQKARYILAHVSLQHLQISRYAGLEAEYIGSILPRQLAHVYNTVRCLNEIHTVRSASQHAL